MKENSFKKKRTKLHFYTKLQDIIDNIICSITLKIWIVGVAMNPALQIIKNNALISNEKIPLITWIQWVAKLVWIFIKVKLSRFFFLNKNTFYTTISIYFFILC